MIQKDLFSEFLTLRWEKENKNINIHTRDLVLADYIIARLNNSGCTIHYLTNGNRVIIPKPWLDIFSALSVYTGARIIHIKDTGDEIDNLIYYMLLVIVYLDLGRGEDLLKVLGKICEVKTTKFREWLKDSHNIELEPLQFISVDNTISI